MIFFIVRRGWLVYNAMDGTTFPMNHGRPLEVRLASMATMIAARMTVLGARPLSAELVQVPREEFDLGMFREGGNAFRRHAEREDAWVGLVVRESEVRETIRELCGRYPK
ncbi:MAG: hypothetical protein ACKVT0_23850 [Planctomycetaceae bacterium]